MDQIKVIIRKPVPEDRNFILSTWLKGQYWGNPYFKQIPQDLYFKSYASIISAVLFLPGMEVNIACDESNPSWIVGFSVFRNDSIYWIHVKKDYREKGIAKLLLSGQPITTAKSITKKGKAILEKKGLIFNPF